MPSSSAIPTLLAPYLFGNATASLTLLTSTLGATTNWLVLRFIHVALQRNKLGDDVQDSETSRIVLVSWLRDVNFWKDGGRKLGVDLQRVLIIDALSSGLSVRPGRMLDVEESILKAVKRSKAAGGGETKLLLVLDGLDFLLATTAYPVTEIIDMVADLREQVDNVIITLSADLALTQSLHTPLEIAHASFVMSLVHQSRMIVSVKGLATGVAKDISGIVSIKQGPGIVDTDDTDGKVEETECLYYVENDGGVKVFERGS